MAWFNTGYDAVDKVYDEIGRNQAERESNNGGGEKRGPFRVRLNGPKYEERNGEQVLVREGETRRYMILDREPISMHEHRFHTYRDDGTKNWNNYEPCKKKQDLGVGTRECEICDTYSKNYPYFVGLHTAMSLTPYFSEAGYEWLFNRYILAARLGSPSRPGMLKRLQRLSQRNNGNMRGVVIECHRRGKKSEVIGDEIDIVEIVPEHEILDWARPKIAQFIERVNRNINDPEKHLTVNGVLNRDPWEPFNFMELIKIRSNQELKNLISRSGQSSGGGGGGYRGNDAPPPGDDDYYGGGSRSGNSGGYSRGSGGGSSYGGDYDSKPSQSDYLDDDIPF